MSSNRELAMKLIGVFNSNEMEGLRALYAENAKHTCPGSDFGVELNGCDAIVEYFKQGVITAFNKVRFDIVEHQKRPVSAAAGPTEVRNVVRVDVQQDNSVDLLLLFDPSHDLAERVLMEQFTP